MSIGVSLFPNKKVGPIQFLPQKLFSFQYRPSYKQQNVIQTKKVVKSSFVVEGFN